MEVDYASEFRYRDPLVGPETLTILLTQSGETADTIAGQREAQAKGSKTLVISNVLGSMVPREAKGTIYTHAGPEIAVASTKTFSAELAALYLFSLYLGLTRGSLPRAEAKRGVRDLAALPKQLESVLEKDEEFEDLARRFFRSPEFLFLGRGVHFPIALEGALKMKKISYIHAEGHPAGEMKHGPQAVISDGLPVVVIATCEWNDADSRKRRRPRSPRDRRPPGSAAPDQRTALPDPGSRAAAIAGLSCGRAAWLGCGPAKESREIGDGGVKSAVESRMLKVKCKTVKSPCIRLSTMNRERLSCESFIPTNMISTWATTSSRR